MQQNIDPKDLKKLIGRINIIDIRDNYLYKLGYIPTSKNIPINFLLINTSSYLNKNELYYIYCEKGTKSAKVCNKLSKEGYHLINITGGYNLYKMQG